MKSPITVDDLYRIKSVENPSVSPRGDFIAYVLWEIDREKNRNRRSIRLLPIGKEGQIGKKGVEAGGSKRLTNSEGSEWGPQWSPDGASLLFCSDRTGKNQLYVIEIQGGEARRLTDLEFGVSFPSWSPDGKRIAFGSPAPDEIEEPAPADPIEKRIRDERRRELDEKSRDPMVHTSVPYRSGTQYFGNRLTHLFVLDVASGKPPVRLTSGRRDFSAPSWSPDGKFLYCDLGRAKSPRYYMDREICRVPAEPGRTRPGKITVYVDKGYTCFNPKVSPDGKTLLYRRSLKAEKTGALTFQTIRTVRGGMPRDIFRDVDRELEFVEWGPTSTRLYGVIGDWGEHRALELDLRTERISEFQQVEGKLFSWFSVNRNGLIAAAGSIADSPSELFFADPRRGRLKPVTALNAEWVADRHLSRPKEFEFESTDGTKVQGWLLLPPKPESKLLPLIVQVHGGPQTMWGRTGGTMWHEFQTMAGAGYAVFYCNPRGSNGYGYEFAHAIHNDWGAAAPDVMSGVETVLETGRIDPRRVFLTGGSYGGWLTAWLTGHSTIFRAAAALRGVYNLSSFDGTTDIPEFFKKYFDGFPWECPDTAWEQSPLAYVERIKTPLLILHGDADYRTPIGDAEQLFSALYRLGVKTELVRYPREGHEQTRSGEPLHRVDSMQRIMQWFEKYDLPKKRR